MTRPQDTASPHKLRTPPAWDSGPTPPRLPYGPNEDKPSMKSPVAATPNAFALSVEKDTAHRSRRNELVAERKHQQEDRILEYVTTPREYARQTQHTLRMTYDEQRQAQGGQRAQARYSAAIQTEQDLQYASAVQRTHQLRNDMRVHQQAEAADANRRAAAEKTQRKQQERAAEQQLDRSTNFMDRFGTTLSRCFSSTKVPAAAPVASGVPAAAPAASVPALEYASSCYLPTSWLELPLVSRKEVSHDSTVYAFGLPKGKSLNLPTCACILLKGPGDTVRPYTPITDTATLGSFELLVRRYPNGSASQHLFGLSLGDTVGFKHIKPNIKAQYPFEGAQNITLLAAGTGITPMYQALLKLMGTPGDSRPVTLLYGSKSVADILLLDELEALASAHPERLTVVHVVGTAPTDPPPAGWDKVAQAVGGWIDEAKIKQHAAPPAEDSLLFVCGLPPMYAALCGPRTEPALAEGSVLQKLGYTQAMVAKM